jgi:hypothetical protein
MEQEAGYVSVPEDELAIAVAIAAEEEADEEGEAVESDTSEEPGAEEVATA